MTSLPKGFTFRDNKIHDRICASRAAILFGDNWRSLSYDYSGAMSTTTTSSLTLRQNMKSLSLEWSSSLSDILTVSSRTDGALHSVAGHPAQHFWSQSGVLVQCKHFECGVLQDYDNGTPAVLSFSQEDGSVVSARSMKLGLLKGAFLVELLASARRNRAAQLLPVETVVCLATSSPRSQSAPTSKNRLKDI